MKLTHSQNRPRIRSTFTGPYVPLPICIVFVLAIFGSLAKVSHAQVSVDFTGGVDNGFQAELTLGYSFRVNEAIVVDQLGFFDDFNGDGAGLQHAHEVRLWTDNAMNPLELAMATLFDVGTNVSSTASEGQWLMLDIPELTLQPGDYVIGAHDPACGGADCDRFRFATTATTIPQIELLQPRTGSGNGFPGSAQDSEDGFFGPTFRARAASIPEPGALGFLIGCLAFAFLGRRRSV